MPRPLTSFFPVVPAQPSPGPGRGAKGAKAAAKAVPTPIPTPTPAPPATKKAAKKVPTPPAPAKKAAKKTTSQASPTTPAAPPASPTASATQARKPRASKKTPSEVLKEVGGGVTKPLPNQQSLFDDNPAPTPAPAQATPAPAPTTVRKPRTVKPKPATPEDMSNPLEPAGAPATRRLSDEEIASMQTLGGKKYLTEGEAAAHLGMSVDALRRAREKYDNTAARLAFSDRGRWNYPAKKVLAYQELINGRIDDEEFARVAAGTPQTPLPQSAPMDNPLPPPASAQSSPLPDDDLGKMLAEEPDPLPTSSTVTTAGQFPGVFTPPRQATPAPSFPSPTPRSAASGVGVRPATAPSPPLPTLLQPQPRMSSRSPTTAPAATQRSMRGAGALGLGLAAGALGYGLGASGRSSMQSPLTSERDGTTEDLARLMGSINGGGGGGVPVLLQTVPSYLTAPQNPATSRTPVAQSPPQTQSPLTPERDGTTDDSAVGSTYGVTNYNPGAEGPPTYSTMGYTGPLVNPLTSRSGPPRSPISAAVGGLGGFAGGFAGGLGGAVQMGSNISTQIGSSTPKMPYMRPERRSPISAAVGGLGGFAGGLGGAVQMASNLSPLAVADQQRGLWYPEVSAIDRAVQASQMANPAVSEPAYDSSQAMQSLDQSSDAFTQGLNILRQRGFRDNPNRAAALLADSQGYDPRVLRSAAQSLGGYDTRWRAGGEFRPDVPPVGEEEMARLRGNEQYRRGAMTTPGGLVSRFGRGGPLGLQALAAQQSERDAEQAFRMRSRVAADQRLIDMSNPMTEEGLANITEGRMPASPTDPFQRRSSTFAFANPANAGANNPLGITGTNRLGMLRMMQAQGQIQEGSDLASELASEEAIARKNREARRSETYRNSVRETLQARAEQKKATSEDRALSRYLKQGYSPTDPFLQQRFPGAVQRWADNLGAGQRQAYGFDAGGQSQTSDMQSPLSGVTSRSNPTTTQMAESQMLLSRLNADTYEPIPGAGYDVFDAYRADQPGAFGDPGTIESKMQRDLNNEQGSLNLTRENLQALQMYAKAAAVSPEYRESLRPEWTPGLTALLDADLGSEEGYQAFLERVKKDREERKSRERAANADASNFWSSFGRTGGSGF